MGMIIVLMYNKLQTASNVEYQNCHHYNIYHTYIIGVTFYTYFKTEGFISKNNIPTQGGEINASCTSISIDLSKHGVTNLL